MPKKSQYSILLSEEERKESDRCASKYTLPYFVVARAKMILFAAQGLEERLSGLDERPRPGRPPVFPPRADHPR